MKASLLKILRRKDRDGMHAVSANPAISGHTRRNYKVISFMVCLLIAFSLWLMSTLSKKYTESLVFGIEYSNFPQPKASYSSTDTLKLKVNSSGYRILAYKMGFIDKTIKIDAGQFKHSRDKAYPVSTYILNNRTHQSKIEEQLGE